MDNNKSKERVIISCSIFKKELEYILAKDNLDIKIEFVNSMLHMKPMALENAIDSKIEKLNEEDITIVLGECHNNTDKYKNIKNIHKIPGINCMEIVLGSENYKKFSREGAFFLLPEWVTRWKEVFNIELGLNDKIAKPFMREMHKYLCYIDTGFYDVPVDQLNEISEYVGLPYVIFKTDLGNLENAIKRTIDE